MAILARLAAGRIDPRMSSIVMMQASQTLAVAIARATLEGIVG